MAVITGIATRDVGRCFSGRRHAIVARATGSENLCVIDRVRRCPDVGIVAILANVCSLNMRGVLAGCIRAVVAIDAGIRDVGVIEVRGEPADGGMAVVAIFTACDMGRRLASGRHAIVAGTAGADDLHVIDGKRRCPDVRVMAVLTDVSGGNVRCVLARRFNAVVAADAVASDVDMVEVRRQPAGRRMAVVALIATRDMRRMFSGRGDTVVAGATGSEDLCVINRDDRYESYCGVAIFADVCGRNVGRTTSGRRDSVMA